MLVIYSSTSFCLSHIVFCVIVDVSIKVIETWFYSFRGDATTAETRGSWKLCQGRKLTQHIVLSFANIQLITLTSGWGETESLGSAWFEKILFLVFISYFHIYWQKCYLVFTLFPILKICIKSNETSFIIVFSVSCTNFWK